jgi:hypothetical protein
MEIRIGICARQLVKCMGAKKIHTPDYLVMGFITLIQQCSHVMSSHCRVIRICVVYEGENFRAQLGGKFHDTGWNFARVLESEVKKSADPVAHVQRNIFLSCQSSSCHLHS